MSLQRKKTNNTFFQDIPQKDRKDKLRDSVMELMTQRSNARRQREQLNSEKLRLRTKMLLNTKLNTQLDFRLDTLMKRYIEEN